ncbi:MAG TPA: hypothetical protein VM575_20745 [Nocardioides sp.]|nr:hypothetical protein [Nocardioides sp.]
MLRPTSLVSAAFALTLLLAGCNGDTADTAPPEADPSDPVSAASSTATTTEVQGHRARYVGPVTTTTLHDPPGVQLVPPRPGQRADLSWTDAFAQCFTGALGCVATGEAEVSLAVVTGPGNAVIGGHQMFEDTLAYVVTWAASSCPPPDTGECRTAYLLTADDSRNVPPGTVVYAFPIPAEV